MSTSSLALEVLSTTSMLIAISMEIKILKYVIMLFFSLFNL